MFLCAFGIKIPTPVLCPLAGPNPQAFLASLLLSQLAHTHDLQSLLLQHSAQSQLLAALTGSGDGNGASLGGLALAALAHTQSQQSSLGDSSLPGTSMWPSHLIPQPGLPTPPDAGLGPIQAAALLQCSAFPALQNLGLLQAQLQGSDPQAQPASQAAMGPPAVQGLATEDHKGEQMSTLPAPPSLVTPESAPHWQPDKPGQGPPAGTGGGTANGSAGADAGADGASETMPPVSAEMGVADGLGQLQALLHSDQMQQLLQQQQGHASVLGAGGALGQGPSSDMNPVASIGAGPSAAAGDLASGSDGAAGVAGSNDEGGSGSGLNGTTQQGLGLPAAAKLFGLDNNGGLAADNRQAGHLGLGAAGLLGLPQQQAGCSALQQTALLQMLAHMDPGQGLDAGLQQLMFHQHLQQQHGVGMAVGAVGMGGLLSSLAGTDIGIPTRPQPGLLNLANNAGDPGLPSVPSAHNTLVQQLAGLSDSLGLGMQGLPSASLNHAVAAQQPPASTADSCLAAAGQQGGPPEYFVGNTPSSRQEVFVKGEAVQATGAVG